VGHIFAQPLRTQLVHGHDRVHYSQNEVGVLVGLEGRWLTFSLRRTHSLQLGGPFFQLTFGFEDRELEDGADES
jgi:hypothetical protein